MSRRLIELIMNMDGRRPDDLNPHKITINHKNACLVISSACMCHGAGVSASVVIVSVVRPLSVSFYHCIPGYQYQLVSVPLSIEHDFQLSRPYT